MVAEFERGKQIAAQSGCLACHKIGENGNDGPGPDLTDIGGAPAQAGDRADAHQPDGADALVHGPAQTAGEVQRAGRLPLAAQGRRVAERGGRELAATRPRVSGTLTEPQVRAMFDRIAAFYDLMNSVMTAGPAPSLARPRGRPRRGRARRPRARRRHRHRRPGGRARAPRRARAARSSARTSRRRCSSPRAREGAPAALRVGQRARARLPGRDASTRPRSASARATSPISTAA